MRTVKRILAVFLLTVVVFTVGYLCYTGSRLSSMTEEPQTEVSDETGENS